MKNEIIFYIEESLEGGYEAKALGYSIFTEGEYLDELKENIRDAVRCHFDEENLPYVIKLHFVREEARRPAPCYSRIVEFLFFSWGLRGEAP